MAEVTETGITISSLAEWVREMQSNWRTAFGTSLEFEAGSVQQQWVGIDSEVLTEVDEAILALGNGVSLNTAVGYQLDANGSWVGNRRRRATFTKVTLTLGGVAGTVVPTGRRIQTAEAVLFATDMEVTIGTTGSVLVTATALTAGATFVAAGTLNRIVDVITGWETVNNTAIGDTGRNRESDLAYRLRQQLQANRNSIGPLQATIIGVQEVDGVTKADGVENPTSATTTIQGVSIDARSMYVVVKGGDDDDIAEAIYNTKTGGSITQGGTTVNLSRGSWQVPVSFTRPTDVPVAISFTIALLDGFPSNGLSQITQRLLDLVDNIGIGEALHDGNVYVAILGTPGFRIVGSVSVVIEGGLDPTTNPQINQLFTLTPGDIAITIQ